LKDALEKIGAEFVVLFILKAAEQSGELHLSEGGDG
jgi:hypothetical protein